jgi:hypothetical protein
MQLAPWRSFEVISSLPCDTLLHRLAAGVPTCTRGYRTLARKDQFFCGVVDVAAGTFRLGRNSVRAKNRNAMPVVVGRVEAVGGKTVVRTTIQPRTFFWCVMMFPVAFGAFIPAGILLWLIGATGGNQHLTFIMIGVLSLLATNWLWGTVLVIQYACLHSFRQEFERLLQRLESQTDARPAA